MRSAGFGVPTPGCPDIRGPGALVYRLRDLAAAQLDQQFPNLAREAVEPIPRGARVTVELIHRPALTLSPPTRRFPHRLRGVMANLRSPLLGLPT